MGKYTRNDLSGDLAPVNSELEKIKVSLDSKLDRAPDVGQANQQESLIDMNSYRMTNLGAPIANTDAARLKDVEEFLQGQASDVLRVINVVDFGSDAAGVQAAFAAAVATAASLGDQYPGSNHVALYFPSGHYNSGGSAVKLTVDFTGFSIFGDGITSQLENIELEFKGAARCLAYNLLLRGSEGNGISSISNGAFLSRQNVFSNIYIRDRVYGVYISGSTWNNWSNVTAEKCSSDGWRVENTDGEHTTNCFSISNTGNGLTILKGGEFKANQFSCHNNVGYGVYLYGTDALTVIENYFTNLTSTIQQATRSYTISNIVDNGGFVQITTTEPHLLSEAMSFSVEGTTNYNTTHIVTEVVDATNFITNVAYVSTETSGSFSLPNWDVYIHSDSANNTRVNDQFFQGGNINYLYIKNGYNLRFVGTRLKTQIYVEPEADLVYFDRGGRGRNPNNSRTDLPIGGSTLGVIQTYTSNPTGTATVGEAGYIISSGAKELGVTSEGVKGTAYHSGNTGSLANDTAYSFTPEFSRGMMTVTNGLGQNARMITISYDTVAGSTAIAGYQGAVFDNTNGVLTGTTGTSGRLTVSAHTDGKIYFETRNGSQDFFWTILR